MIIPLPFIERMPGLSGIARPDAQGSPDTCTLVLKAQLGELKCRWDKSYGSPYWVKITWLAQPSLRLENIYKSPTISEANNYWSHGPAHTAGVARSPPSRRGKTTGAGWRRGNHGGLRLQLLLLLLHRGRDGGHGGVHHVGDSPHGGVRHSELKSGTGLAWTYKI